MTRNGTSEYIMNTQIRCFDQNASTCDEKLGAFMLSLNVLMEEAVSFASYQYSLSYKNNQKFVQSLQEKWNSLEAEINRIIVSCSVDPVHLGGLLDDSNLAIANLSLAARDRQWLQFEYDSHSSSIETNTRQSSTSVHVSAGLRFFFFGGGASFSYNKKC